MWTTVGARDAEAENSPINRELALLRPAFYLGYEATPPKVFRVPSFSHARREQHPREVSERRRLRQVGRGSRGSRSLDACFGRSAQQARLAPVRALGKASCSASQSIESDDDLNPGETKNKDARFIEMTQEVHAIVSVCVEGKRPDDLVFTREDGKPSVTWYKVCRNIGLGTMSCCKCDRAVTTEVYECGCPDSH